MVFRVEETELDRNKIQNFFLYFNKLSIRQQFVQYHRYLMFLFAGTFFLFLLICGNQNKAADTRAKTTFRRIISLAPFSTEILFALGLGENIIGVTKFCKYPLEANSKHQIGGYMDLNFEGIISLDPDLVVATPSHKEILTKLERLKIETLSTSANNLDQIYQSILTIGEHTGQTEQAETLVTNIKSQINHCLEANPVNVMLVVGRSAGSLQGLYVTGGDSFLSELLEMAGGRNIFCELNGYLQPSFEEIISLNPEMIIEIRSDEYLTEEEKTSLKEDWRILHNIDAVAEGNIFVCNEPYLTIPGPRIAAVYNQFKEVFNASTDK